MKRRTWSLCLLALGAVSGAGQAQIAYLPAEGRGVTAITYKSDEYDSAWQGDEFQKYPIATKTRLMLLWAEFGIAENWAIDLLLGYGGLEGNSLGATPGPDKQGRLDSFVGARWRAIDERLAARSWVPTVTLRAGLVIAGDYDPRPQALGDGQSGAEFGVYLGKSFERGFGVLGDISYRESSDPVPEALYGSIGAYKVFRTSGLVLRGTYRFKEGLSGYGHFRTLMGAPPQARKETYGVRELSLVYPYNQAFFELSHSRTASGFNTARRQTTGLSITLPLPF